MRHLLWITATTWLLIAFGGCCSGPTVDTVPWWKGLPCMVIAPSSLEGMVWRDHLQAKHASEAAYLGDAEYLETEWVAPAESDAVETESELPAVPAAPEIPEPSGDLAPLQMPLDAPEPPRSELSDPDTQQST